MVSASKKLDYEGIIRNDMLAVSQLKKVLAELDIEIKSSEALDKYASKQRTARASGDSSDSEQADPKAKQTRVRAMMASLRAEGMEERLGRVYNSFASDRIMKFTDVPHRLGLPPFDAVIAADYAPISGLHGVFISDEEVKSIVLASEGGSSSQWQELKSRTYNNADEMLELVALLSSGFELP